MDEKKNKVSVIIPVYNDAEFLFDTIQSVVNQTFDNWEIVIVNDGSTDGATIKIINDIEQKFKKTRVIHTINGGPARARNIGIEQANGEYILPLDADDLIYPTYIEKAIDIIEHNNDIGIVYCEAEFTGKKSGKWDLPKYDLLTMLYTNVIFVTALFRKKDWYLVGGFDESLKNGIEDYDFWLALIERDRKVYQIPEVLFKYRIKEVSRTTLFMKDKDKYLQTYKQILNNHIDLYQKHVDQILYIHKKKEIELNAKIERIKKMFPGYNFINNNLKLKNILKKILKIN